MPTHTRPTIRRSCEEQSLPCEGRGTFDALRLQQPSSSKRRELTRLAAQGSPEGGSPSGKGCGGCAPTTKKTSEGGWVGKTNVAMPTQVSPPLWVQGLPCALFPFVGFSPSFTGAVGPHSARALADTACLPLSTFPTPPSGALGPPSGQCLADTTCPPLSTCPSRLKPKLHRVPPGTGRPENYAHTIPLNQIAPLPPARVAVRACSWGVRGRAWAAGRQGGGSIGGVGAEPPQQRGRVGGYLTSAC